MLRLLIKPTMKRIIDNLVCTKIVILKEIADQAHNDQHYLGKVTRSLITVYFSLFSIPTSISPFNNHPLTFLFLRTLSIKMIFNY